jgi:hypothetical protein
LRQGIAAPQEIEVRNSQGVESDENYTRRGHYREEDDISKSADWFEESTSVHRVAYLDCNLKKKINKRLIVSFDDFFGDWEF